MLKIAKLPEINMQDDVFFDRIALVLYAQGCRWKCKGCHSKLLWDFEKGILVDIEIVEEKLNFLNLKPSEITLVGEGGDFWFQLENWIDFCQRLKEKYPDIKIVWHTGATREMVRQKFGADIYPFDIVLCERPFAEKLTGKNMKYWFMKENGEIKEFWEEVRS